MISPRKAHALLAPALALTMLLPSVGTPIATASSATAIVLDSTRKVHPVLQAGAQLDPTSLVRVIVQKTKADAKADSLLSHIPGAQLSEEFTVIPGFVAILPQAAVALLAVNPNVRYISPDGPVDVIPGKPPKGSKAAADPKAPKTGSHSKRRFNASKLLTTFPVDTGASDAWSTSAGHAETGFGIAVAGRRISGRRARSNSDQRQSCRRQRQCVRVRSAARPGLDRGPSRRLPDSCTEHLGVGKHS
jgi:hypothetical protein